MKLAKNLILGMTVLFLSGMLVVLGVLGYYSRKIPNIDALINYNPKLVTTVYSRDNEVLAEFARERRKFLPTKDMPRVAIDAFISAEDSDFFHHRGINPLTILRAAWKNFKAGAKVQGGSTITQQVAKYFLLSNEKSIDRKIKEVLLAFKIEKALSKEEIINLYLNQIFLGNGAYGVEAASRIYFGKPASEMTIAEAAILAGLPRAPSRDNPVANPAAAKMRQRYVLGRLYATQRITKEQYEEALTEPVKIIVTPVGQTTEVPYLTEYIRRELIQRFGEEKVYEGGLSVYTTASLKNQLAAQDAINAGLRVVDKRMGLRRPQKRIAKGAAMEKYFKDEHRKLTESFYNYRILLPDEPQLKDPIQESEPTPLEIGKDYEAMVVGKEPKTRALIVRVGTRTGKILPEDYAWAARANPEEIYSEKVIRNPYMEYREGDLITAKLRIMDKDKDKDVLLFALEQNPLVQGALISYSTKTGGLEAIVGGYDFEVTKSEFNRATQALRQPGSTFKPFVYGAAIESGLTPSTIIVDSPIVYNNTNEKEGLEKIWKPGNYSEKFYGDTTLRNALAYSRNIPTIKLAQYLKISSVIDFARRMGITSELQPDLSLALGSSAIGLNELVKAWTPFTNKGKKIRTLLLTKVTDRNGENLFEDINAGAVNGAGTTAETGTPSETAATATTETPTTAVADAKTADAPDPEQPITPEVAYIVTTLLKSVVDFGTATALQGLGRAVAAKTGTTSDYKDAWAMGYTTDMITGIWVGFDEDRPIGRNETGSLAAVPIWLNYMQVADPKTDKKEEMDFEMPKNVIRVTVDAKTGDLPNPRTEKTIQEYFIDGNAPGQTPKPIENTATRNATVSTLDQKIKTKIITGNPDFVGTQQDEPSGRDEGLDEMIREDL